MALHCCRRSAAKMTTRERLFLTSFEKFVKYGIVPWKMLLHVALVAIVTGQIVFNNGQEINYLQAASRNWYYYLYPDDYDFSDPGWYTYTIDDTVTAMQKALTNFYGLNGPSLDNYTYSLDAATGQPTQATLTIVRYAHMDTMFDPATRFDAETVTSSYTVNASWLGPLDPTVTTPADTQQFFYSLVSMTLSFPLIQHFSFGSVYRNCFQWALDVEYDFTNRGQIALWLDQEIVGSCDTYASYNDALADKALWLSAVVLGLSLLHLVLIVKGVLRSVALYFSLTRWAAGHSSAVRRAARGLTASSSSSTAPHQHHRAASSNAAAATPSGGDAGGVSGSGSRSGRSRSRDPSPDLGAAGIRLAPLRGRDSFSNGSGSSGGGGLQQSLLSGDSLQMPSVSASGSLNAPTAGGGGDSEEEEDAAAQEEAQRLKTQAAVLSAAAEALDVRWADLPWRDRLRFLSGWTVLDLIADACNIAASSRALRMRTTHIPDDEAQSLVIAIGVSLLWLGLVRYMEHNRNYFNLILTLRRAAPRVARFLVGVLPVFASYVLFSVIVFGNRIPRFADMRTGFVTLFANMNGDVIRETFMAILAYHPITGQFFFYTFVSLHIYVILNIVVAVVEESYFITVQRTADYEARLLEEEAAAKQETAARAAGLSSGSASDSSSGSATRASGGRSSSSSSGDALAPILSAIAAELDPLAVAPTADSHSVKDRGDSRLVALLRLREWEEVVLRQQAAASEAAATAAAMRSARSGR